MEPWYTLYTRPGQEGRVIATLNELGVETFFPWAWRQNRAGVRRRTACFPCYVFALIDLEAWPASVRQWMPGLRRIVSFGGTPAVMPDVAVALLRNLFDQLNQDQGSPRDRFSPGDPVRITASPLADMVGLFERECAPAERVSVLLNFLGRACHVQMDISGLTRATPEPQPSKSQPLESNPLQKRPTRRTRGHGRYIGLPA